MTFNKPVRILHVEASTSYGGSIRALQSYLANSRQGDFAHDVLLYHPTDGIEFLTPLVSKVITLGDQRPRISVREPRWNRLKTAVRRLIPDSLVETLSEVLAVAKSIPTCIRIFRFLRTSDYDLVHVNNTFSFQPATLIAAKLARIPIVAHVRNPQRPSLIDRFLIRAADSVVTVCRYHERQVESWQSGVPVVTCYDSVEPPFADEHAVANLKSELQEKGCFLIGSVGRLDEQKGYADLIVAARHIAERRSDFNIVIAGDGPLRRQLQQLVSTLELKDRVKLCGFRSDVPLFLKSLDLFVSPSHWEGLPLVVVEAMLLKVPVVVTDVCGNSEVVLPWRTGVLVGDRDPVALAEGIITVLDAPGRERLMVDNAEKLASRLFSPIANACSLDEVFRGTLYATASRALQCQGTEYSR
jgi:glycosyltransferase involved in cell wall biosynthesis